MNRSALKERRSPVRRRLKAFAAGALIISAFSFQLVSVSLSDPPDTPESVMVRSTSREVINKKEVKFLNGKLFVGGAAVDAALNGKEPALGNPTTDGYSLHSLINGARYWGPDGTGPGGGPPSFPSMLGHAGQFLTNDGTATVSWSGVAFSSLTGKLDNSMVSPSAAIDQAKLNLNGVIPPGWLGATANTAAAGNDSRLSDARTPLDDSVTNAKVTAAAGIVQSKLNLNGVIPPGWLGSTATTAAAGNDSRLTDTRVPNDASVNNAKVAATAAIDQSKLNLNGSIPVGWLGNTSVTAAAGNDARLSDTRVPTDASITDVKIANAADIDPAKIAGEDYGRGFIGIDTAQNARNYIQLGNVDNTSDATKNAANTALTNHTIDGTLNIFQHIPTSAIDFGPTVVELDPPGAMRLLIWDENATPKTFQWLRPGTGIQITGTSPNYTISATGSGDVSGPASSVNNHVAFFSGTTGKTLVDSGLLLSGTNTGDQTISLTGEVTGSGTGSFGATIASGAVTNIKVSSSAAIDWSKINKTGAGMSDIVGNVAARGQPQEIYISRTATVDGDGSKDSPRRVATSSEFDALMAVYAGVPNISWNFVYTPTGYLTSPLHTWLPASWWRYEFNGSVLTFDPNVTISGGGQLKLIPSSPGVSIDYLFVHNGTLDANWPALAMSAPIGAGGRTLSDVATTNGSATIKSASAHFTKADLFKPVRGSGVPESPATTIASGSNGAALPQSTIHITDTTGFPASGTVTIIIGGSFQVISYTGRTTSSGAGDLTGCTGGSGTLATGQAIISPTRIVRLPSTTFTAASDGVNLATVSQPFTLNVTSTTDFASAGTAFAETSTGRFNLVTYTGKTSGTLTGCTTSGTTGIIGTGMAVTTWSQAVLSNAATATATGVSLSVSGEFNVTTVAWYLWGSHNRFNKLKLTRTYGTQANNGEHFAGAFATPDITIRPYTDNIGSELTVTDPYGNYGCPFALHTVESSAFEDVWVEGVNDGLNTGFTSGGVNAAYVKNCWLKNGHFKDCLALWYVDTGTEEGTTVDGCEGVRLAGACVNVSVGTKTNNTYTNNKVMVQNRISGGDVGGYTINGAASTGLHLAANETRISHTGLGDYSNPKSIVLDQVSNSVVADNLFDSSLGGAVTNDSNVRYRGNRNFDTSVAWTYSGSLADNEPLDADIALQSAANAFTAANTFTAATAGPAVAMSATGTGTDLNLLNTFAPNQTSKSWINFGQSGSTNNAAALGFEFIGNGSTSNNWKLGFWNGPTVLTGSASGDAIFGGNLTITGLTANNYVKSNGSKQLVSAATIPFSDISSTTGAVTDTMLASAVKPAVAVVATSNLTLSGEQTIDGQLTSASLVLATAQTTGSQNGPWITASGAWTRPGWYSAGSTTQAPQFLEVMHARLGTSHQGEVWKMTTAGVTIDTTATTWTLVPPNLNNAVGTLPVANGGTGITSFGSGVATALGTAVNTTGGFSPINGTATFTNKTIDLASNTLTGTIAQFNTALSDGDFATLAGTETLTNKTLTAPTISTINAASATNLSLNAGSSGATGVFGQGANGDVTLTAPGTGAINLTPGSTASGSRLVNIIQTIGGTWDVGLLARNQSNNGYTTITAKNNAGSIFQIAAIGSSVSGTTAGIANSNLLEVGSQGGTLLFGTFVNSPLVFATNNAERLRLLTTGELTGSLGSGTDQTGGAATFAGGQSTGTGRGGAVITQTANSSTTGSSANSLSTRRYDSAKFVDLTEGSATLVGNIALASSKYLGVRLNCTIAADDGTDFQAVNSNVSFSAVNKAGTVTVGTVTQNDDGTAASSGTLTVTYTAVANGSGVDIKANATSSLTQTSLRCKWSVLSLNSNDAGAVTPQ